jgi:benzoyl-CoA reductase subunit A
MTEEYWRWPESSWTSGDIDWKKAKTVTAGVDIGAVSTQAVITCDDTLYSYNNMRTGSDGDDAEKAMAGALKNTDMTLKDIHYIVGTGWGGKFVPFAHKVINEVSCHAKGARFMFGPSVRTIVDIGGQTVKVIKLYEWDRVSDFAANDKCATGMGRSIEKMADLMHVPIWEMGERSLSVKNDPEPASTTCYNFCNTEVLGLFREGLSEGEVLATYLFTLAYRIYTLVGRVKPEKYIAFTGGVAKNVGITKRLERELSIDTVHSQYDTQLAGAIGAALLAKTLMGKSIQPTVK